MLLLDIYNGWEFKKIFVSFSFLKIQKLQIESWCGKKVQ